MATVPADELYVAANARRPVGAGPLCSAPDFENEEPCAGQKKPLEVISTGANPACGHTSATAMKLDAELR